MRNGSALSCLILFLSVGCQSPAVQTAHDEGERAHEHELELSDRVQLSREALESLRLEYATAEVRSLSPSLAVPAELMPIPDRQVMLGPRVSGRVVRAQVNVGDRVRSGAPVVIMESAEVGRARADLVAAVARQEVAERAFDRARSLLEDRVTSERSVEEARGTLQVAEADVLSAETKLRSFGVELREPGGVGDPAHVVLRSPMAGTVVSRSVLPGEWVEPSDVLMEIIALDRLWLLASVYEREMRTVSEGQSVDVEVRAFPGEVFPGEIESVAPTLEAETRSVQVRVVLANPSRRLRPGMFATARIRDTHVHEPRELLAIPWSAVQEIDGHPAVFVQLDEGVFELRSIHHGERAGEDVEVLNGLVPGDVLVSEGSFLLKGQLLRSTLGDEH